jgi:tetratricopeptide (TPR) repeat protein
MKRLLLLMLVVTCLVEGCRRPESSSRRVRSATSGQSPLEHLKAAMDYLTHADEFEEEQTIGQVAYHLNRWIDAQTLTDDWQPDPLIRRLPPAFRDIEALEDLDRLRFQREDVKPLQEAVWMQQVSQWVSRRPAKAPLEAWLRSDASGLEAAEAGQLAVAHRLFDWTIRNVQLDELLPYPADAIAGPTLKPGERAPPRVPPPQRCIPGPGYQYYPWQTLLYGHGDALQRARVFLLLCRQQAIDAVMLAFPGRTTPPRPRPWVAAVRLDQRLFLFDTRLGLPIPGPDGQGVATLEQVLDDPPLLSALSVGRRFSYDVESADMEEILALVDASAASLSRRMQLVQQALTAEHRAVLTCAPTRIAERVRACQGVSNAVIWTLPFETTWYQTALLDKVAQDPAATAQYYRETGVFSMRTPLVRARYLHFRDVFDNRDEQRGAKSLYLQARIPQAQIDRLETSEDVRETLGLVQQQGERDVMWRARLASSKMMMAQAKQHATYWLGLAQYDTGKYESAVEWLERRTLKDDPDGPWKHSATYNLARAYEALGQAERARELYLADIESPQRHGNLVRARAIEQSANP